MAIDIVRLVNKLSIYIQFSNQFRWICHLVLSVVFDSVIVFVHKLRAVHHIVVNL